MSAEKCEGMEQVLTEGKQFPVSSICIDVYVIVKKGGCLRELIGFAVNVEKALGVSTTEFA